MDEDITQTRGVDVTSVLCDMLKQLRADQTQKPTRERAVLITDLEKAQVWAEHHGI